MIWIIYLKESCRLNFKYHFSFKKYPNYAFKDFIKIARLDLANVGIIWLTLPVLRLLSSKAQGRKDFRNYLNPAMLVFIG